MKENWYKILVITLFISGCLYLSKQHNDTYAASPWSNIHTSQISTGFLLRTNDGATNMAWWGYQMYMSGDGNSNILAFFNGTNWIFSGVALTTNAWAGPTNTLDVRTNHNYFVAGSSVAVTGFTGSSGQQAWNPVLKIKNSNLGLTNITITIPLGVQLPLGDSNPYTLTNGDTWIGSFDYSDGQTNIMAKVWHHQ